MLLFARMPAGPRGWPVHEPPGWKSSIDWGGVTSMLLRLKPALGVAVRKSAALEALATIRRAGSFSLIAVFLSIAATLR
jgi:hypothetical protein